MAARRASGSAIRCAHRERGPCAPPGAGSDAGNIGAPPAVATAGAATAFGGLGRITEKATVSTETGDVRFRTHLVAGPIAPMDWRRVPVN